MNRIKKNIVTMNKYVIIALCLFATLSISASNKKKPAKEIKSTELHLAQPVYNVKYGAVDQKDVKTVIDKVYKYISGEGKNTFSLTSYEWGVTYQALLKAYKATGDKSYADYVEQRFMMLANKYDSCRAQMYNTGSVDAEMRAVVNPRALDDAGAMSTAMMKWRVMDHGNNKYMPMIDNYFNYIEYHQDRLNDGTFCRQRPQRNSVWMDDLFMSVPAILNYAHLKDETRDDATRFYSDAVRQIDNFSDRLFNPQKGLWRHAWVEDMTDHPSFYWARSNGWAILSLCEALDQLPNSYAGRDKIMSIYKQMVSSLIELQDEDGFWHQLLDRPNSYQETSATAIFTYAIAHGINSGWLDASAYGPSVLSGWHAIASKVNEEGQVEGTCVGTGMGFDASYYMHRPVNAKAAHGYGPVIMASAEVYTLLEKQHPRMNDGAVQFYKGSVATGGPIFAIADPTRGEELTAGSSRINESAPVVFICGDSTVKNGRGKGDGGMWGWGDFLEQFLDSTRVTSENHALGGRSSRTYYTEGLWDKVLPGIKKGDFVLIQFGHNDGGPLNTGRARASLNGSDETNQTVIMEKNGGPETVYTFGHYIRLFVRQAKSKGATVIVMSYTPGNSWSEDGKMRRCTDTYAAWSKSVAQEEGVYYIDENDLAATKFEALGEQEAKKLYKDSVHTIYGGAIINCEAIIQGVRNLTDCPLNKYLK
jgi:unsaturated rhamnogalacturonyl hydrolase